MIKIHRFSFLLILLISFAFQSQTLVTSNSELQTAINNATAGSEIILANGVWTNTEIDIYVNATASNPVIISAENYGQVFLEGNSSVSMGGSYIIVEGFVFQNASGLITSSDRIDPIIEFRDDSNRNCTNCTVSNIKIDGFNGTSDQATAIFKWVILYGSYNEISHSSFINKYGVGSIINDNRNDGLANYHKIHHNYFASRTAVGDVNDLNDQDAIRLGNSSTSLSDSFTEIYDNFFYDWEGEVEIISNKSGQNKYYNNTFRNYSGTLTLRHGNGCEVFNNYFIAEGRIFSGGIRVIGEDHIIYNNYVEGINAEKPDGSNTKTTGAINISNGRENSELNGYYQVKNVTIVNNTFVDCDYGFRVGTTVSSDLTLAPENVIIANTVIQNTSENAFDVQTNLIGDASKIEGNINYDGSWDLSNGVDDNRTVSTEIVEAGSEFYRITATSEAVDAGIGSYTFLTNDILEGIRSTDFDAGAEEFGASGTNLPYTVADVGDKVGFLSGVAERLLVSENSLNFNRDANTVSVEISSNTSWTVSENEDWLTVDKTSGNENETLQIEVTQNDSGSSRTALITIATAENALETTISVTQSTEAFDSNNAIEITGIAVTGVGTQDPNIPENTLDGDVTTRWSANSDDGSTYLTYNLGCIKTVSSVKIYFHKGSTRTSSFKIATSTNGINFTEVTEELTSSGNTVGFEEFVLSPFQEVQYVRILGFGNSEGSGWNSYEEVQIFGNNSCETLSTTTADFSSKGISIYPVPTSKGILNISAQSTIGKVEVFDVTGKQISSKIINDSKGFIETTILAKGVYIIKISDAFSRFLVE
ncbi:discoidin domain-containing protein [Polaribacter sp.]|nr:discoidin domain-containing protein [Polaribacter sp.]